MVEQREEWQSPVFGIDEAGKHCVYCGYDLRGLIEPRCPECGEAFSRGSVRRFHVVPLFDRVFPPRSMRRGLLLFVAMVALGFFIARMKAPNFAY